MQFSDLVTSHYQTSEASPFCIEGTFSDGRVFYFKYRFRWATLKIAPTQSSLVADSGISVEPPFQLDAWMTRPEFEMLIVDMYHLHNTKYGDTITVES